jgi:hypothetical protein
MVGWLACILPKVITTGMRTICNCGNRQRCQCRCQHRGLGGWGIAAAEVHGQDEGDTQVNHGGLAGRHPSESHRHGDEDNRNCSNRWQCRCQCQPRGGGCDITAAEVHRQDKGEVPLELINLTQQAGERQRQAAGRCVEMQVDCKRLPLGHSGSSHQRGSCAVAALMSKRVLQG